MEESSGVGCHSLEQGIQEKSALLFRIQSKSKPAWGLQTDLMQCLQELNLDIVDHRSWHARQSAATLLNEIFVKSNTTLNADEPVFALQKAVEAEASKIASALASTMQQNDALIRVQRWLLDLSGSQQAGQSVSEQVIYATNKPDGGDHEDYIWLGDGQKVRQYDEKDDLERGFNGRLEGLIRRDGRAVDRVRGDCTYEQGFELLDVHGVGSGYFEVRDARSLV